MGRTDQERGTPILSRVGSKAARAVHKKWGEDVDMCNKAHSDAG